MKFSSGLDYSKLKAIADADAVDSLSAGGVKAVTKSTGTYWQYVLNYQVADPTSPTGKRQARVTHMSNLKASGRGSKTRKSMKDNYLPRWREQVIADVRSISGVRLDPEASVRECVESWIDQSEKRKSKPIRKSTAANYRQIAKRIFRYPLSRMRMIDINPNVIQSMLDDLAVTDEKKKKKGLGHKSIRDTHALLSQVCAAVLGKDNNPCKLADGDSTGITLPDGQPTKRTRSGQLNILSEAGVAKALQVLDGLDSQAELDGTFDPVALAARITFNVALRSEEVAALQWKDVDLYNGQLNISHVIERTETPIMDENGVPVRDANGNIKTQYSEFDTRAVYSDASRFTKSAHSKRTLNLAPDVVAVLIRRKEQVARELREIPRIERRSIGDLYVLGGTDGDFFSVRTLCKRWKRIAESEGLYGQCGDACSFHNIRHTVGSQLAAKVMSMKALSQWMGHSSIRTTERYYVQVDADALSVVSDAAAELNSQRPVEGVTPFNEWDRAAV